MHASIRAQLAGLADPVYRDFSCSLIPGCTAMLGVRIPVLRRMAKSLSQGGLAGRPAGGGSIF